MTNIKHRNWFRFAKIYSLNKNNKLTTGALIVFDMCEACITVLQNFVR